MHYPVVVAGGGPAGALAALKLTRAGVGVLVVDRPRPTRVEAAEILSPEGHHILHREKVWHELPLDLSRPCPAMAAAWDTSTPAWFTFDDPEYGCAWHIDRIRFDAWMLHRIAAEGATVEAGSVEHVERAGGGWRVAITVAGGDRVVTADALMLATGRTPRDTRLAPRRRIDTLCLVAGTAEPDTSDPDVLMVEATPDGWWYSAPLMNGALFVGWMTDFSLVAGGHYREAAMQSLPAAPIHARRVTRPRLTHVIGSAAWARTPAAGPGWIAIGDAALARDPISGDGLTSALHSAAEGADVVLRALRGDTSAWTTAATHAAVVSRRYTDRRIDLYRRAAVRWPDSRFWQRFAREQT